VAGKRLLWVDIPAGAVHSLTTAGADSVVASVDSTVGSVLLRSRGGLVLATSTGVELWSAEGEVDQVIAIEADRLDTRMNDAACDARGRLWAGTMAVNGEGRLGSLYRVDPVAGVQPVKNDLGISNGIGWSPDGLCMYHVDSADRTVWAHDYDIANGDIGSPRALVRLEANEGEPDGIQVLVDGSFWLAAYGAGQLRRYTSEGEFVDTIDVATPLVTSCTAGGSQMSTLFITTAGATTDGDDRLAGAIFSVEIDIPGLVQHMYAG